MEEREKRYVPVIVRFEADGKLRFERLNAPAPEAAPEAETP